MNALLTLLANREKAMVIWLAVAVICFLFNKGIRRSLRELLSILFSPQILEVMSWMLIWVAAEVLCLRALQLWDVSLAKDTILWTFGTAFVYATKTVKSRHTEHYFFNAFVDNLKMSATLEFVMNFHEYNLATEIILLPIVVLIGSISILAPSGQSGVSVKKIANSAILLFGTFLIFSAIVYIIRNYRDFLSMQNFHAFLLPILLTLLYLPFLYVLELYASYESLCRVRLFVCRKSSPSVARYACRKVFSLCLLNLRRLNTFIKDEDVSIALFNLRTRDDVVHMIQEARRRGL